MGRLDHHDWLLWVLLFWFCEHKLKTKKNGCICGTDYHLCNNWLQWFDYICFGFVNTNTNLKRKKHWCNCGKLLSARGEIFRSSSQRLITLGDNTCFCKLQYIHKELQKDEIHNITDHWPKWFNPEKSFETTWVCKGSRKGCKPITKVQNKWIQQWKNWVQ